MFETKAERKKKGTNGLPRYFNIQSKLDRHEMKMVKKYLKENGHMFPADFVREAIWHYLKENIE